MKMLRAKQRKSFYKNDNAWLNAVYRNNKQLIDSAYSQEDIKTLSDLRGIHSARAAFKYGVRDMKNDIYLQDKLDKKHITTYEALKGYVRTERLTDVKERLVDNAISGMKKHLKDKNLEAFRRIIGWNDKIKWSNFKYDKEEHTYSYTGSKGTAYISFFNSPEGFALSSSEITYTAEEKTARARKQFEKRKRK